MTDATRFPDEPTLFEARLKPHRSLTRAGFAAVMLAVAGASFTLGAAFLMMGAWPVFGFLGLDVLLVYAALRASFRSARAYEDIHVTPNLLRVRQVSHYGHERENVANPRWVRMETERDEDYGMTRLALISRGVPLVIGAFLPPAQREQVAHGLGSALAEAKR